MRLSVERDKNLLRDDGEIEENSVTKKFTNFEGGNRDIFARHSTLQKDSDFRDLHLQQAGSEKSTRDKEDYRMREKLLEKKLQTLQKRKHNATRDMDDFSEISFTAVDRHENSKLKDHDNPSDGSKTPVFKNSKSSKDSGNGSVRNRFARSLRRGSSISEPKSNFQKRERNFTNGKPKKDKPRRPESKNHRSGRRRNSNKGAYKTKHKPFRMNSKISVPAANIPSTSPYVKITRGICWKKTEKDSRNTTTSYKGILQACFRGKIRSSNILNLFAIRHFIECVRRKWNKLHPKPVASS